MRLYLLIVLVLLGLDQATKFLVVSAMELYESIEVIPGFFNLVYVTNKGAAFSMFASADTPLRHYFFVSVNSIAFVALTVAAFRMAGQHPLCRAALGMIAAGAAGNLIDRLRYGAVVDFLDFYLGRYHWPAFNVADASICVGVAVLVLLNIIELRKEQGRSHA